MAIINGDNGDNLDLKGTDQADIIKGLGGVDNLTGGLGADQLFGGTGSDRAFYDDSFEGVTILLGAGPATGGTAEGDVLDGIENITASDFDDFIHGDAEDNIIDGRGGVDTLKGLGGDDILRGSGHLEGNAGDDSLRGQFGADTLLGGSGDDVLDGREGADLIDGGAGIDTVLYEASDAGVTVIFGEGAASNGDGGDAAGDRLRGVENLTGSSFDDHVIADNARNVLIGDAGNDTLKGLGGQDTLDGGIGVDTLEGGGDSDRLIGGFNADRLDGGDGFDTADYVDSDAGVSVNLNENKATGGDAQGDTFVSIENLDGSEFDDTLIGSAVSNVLFGDQGDDVLKGLGGSDQLFGASSEDTLLGGDGADLLDGGDGDDAMFGGAGDDTYIANSPGDVVNESTFGGSGTDLVQSRTSFSLSGVNVLGGVENLTLTGNANVNAVGNALANVLTGNNDANSLNGNSGADRMIGRGGDDDYVVNEAGDIVDETGGGGVDEVLSFVSLSLSGPKVLGAVENLRLGSGTAAINAAGNGLDNVLTGNSGKNDLMGLAGDDTLTGGSGADTFIFNAALNAATNVDEITDFSVPLDTIRLENAFMSGLKAGALGSSAFHIGAAAADASDRIIYDDDAGALFFDRDGAGGAAAIRFAELDADLAMTNQDFFVV